MTLSPVTLDVVRSIAERHVDVGAAPGVSLAIVRDGAVVARVVAGHADLERSIPTQDEHLFEIGSISKSFTALAILSLVDEGRLSLDDEVTTHLPWFEVRSAYAPITLRHLLDHSSGLVMGADALPDEASQVWSLRSSDTGSAPGTIFHYSNVGFMTLGQVVGAVTGRPCHDVVRDVVLDPVGMTSSVSTVTDDDRLLMAVGYQPWYEDRAWRPGDPLAPATFFEVSAADGNVASTAGDMGRYLAMLLRRGEIDGRRVVSDESWVAMTTPSSPGGEPAPVPSRYALGINVEEIGGRTALTHGGGMVGYSSFLIGELDRRFGVVVLTNAPGDTTAAQWLARAVYDVVRADVEGAPAQPDARPTYVPDPRPEPVVGSDGSVDARLASYVGHYRSFSPWFTHLRVVAREGRLLLVAPNGVEAPGTVDLVELSPGVFREGDDPRLPERLTIGPVVDGAALWVERHECRYTRTFRD